MEGRQIFFTRKEKCWVGLIPALWKRNQEKQNSEPTSYLLSQGTT